LPRPATVDAITLRKAMPESDTFKLLDRLNGTADDSDAQNR